MEEKKIFVTKATLPPKEEFIQYVDKITKMGNKKQNGLQTKDETQCY
mgnify:CR=1 FL=1